jgi:hypothetical protein
LQDRESAWERINTWEFVLPPSRPSPLHLNVFSRELSKINCKEPVAVLGSTPEIRDLLFEMSFREVFVFEKFETVFDHLTRLRCYQSSENLIWGDWRQTLCKHKNTFGAILSDLTSGNIPYEDRERFYLDVSSALQEHGKFIDRVLTLERGTKSLKSLINIYQSLPLNLATLNAFSCDFFFVSDLVSTYGIIDTTIFYQELRLRLASPKLRRFLQDVPIITPAGCAWYYGQPWDEVKKSYFQSLSLVESYEEDPASPYAGNLRLFVSLPNGAR